jgi:hypothetical protein
MSSDYVQTKFKQLNSKAAVNIDQTKGLRLYLKSADLMKNQGSLSLQSRNLL